MNQTEGVPKLWDAELATQTPQFGAWTHLNLNKAQLTKGPACGAYRSDFKKKKKKKCRTFLDLVSFKAFLRRFSSFSSSSTSDSSALLWGDLPVWRNCDYLSKVGNQSGSKSWILGVYQVAILLSINCKSEEALSLFCTKNTLVSYIYRKFQYYIFALVFYILYKQDILFCIVWKT